MQAISLYNDGMNTYAERFPTTGQRIKARLVTLKISQKELAAMMSERGEPVSDAFVSQLVNNQRGIAVDKLAALATILKTTTDHLLCLPWADNPELPTEDTEAVIYFSLEADETARILDTLTPQTRQFIRMLVTATAEFERQRISYEWDTLLNLVEELIGPSARAVVKSGLLRDTDTVRLVQ